MICKWARGCISPLLPDPSATRTPNSRARREQFSLRGAGPPGDDDDDRGRRAEDDPLSQVGDDDRGQRKTTTDDGGEEEEKEDDDKRSRMTESFDTAGDKNTSSP